MLEAVNATLTAPWPLLKEGTILDTALIATRSLPWNNTGARDAEMHHNKKCYLCTSMKAHLGVDAELALAHTIICAAANVNDESCPTRYEPGDGATIPPRCEPEGGWERRLSG